MFRIFIYFSIIFASPTFCFKKNIEFTTSDVFLDQVQGKLANLLCGTSFPDKLRDSKVSALNIYIYHDKS